MGLFDTLTDALTAVNDYVAHGSENVTKAITGAANRAKRTPDGQLQQQVEDRVSTPSLDQIRSNPIINMGIDTANEAITKISQQLIVTGAGKLEAFINKAVGIPIRKTIQDATNSYFSIIALATTASTEVVMEIARVCARQIIQLTKDKDSIIDELQKDLAQLFNAIQILLNSAPFFTDYLNKLIQAYNLIATGNRGLKGVVFVLKTKHRYQTFLFDQSLVQLTQARDLILPDRTAEVGEIGSLDFITSTFTRKTNKDALAAALSIPGISFRLGKQLLQYLKVTIQINGLITIFMTYLDDFISTFKRSDNIDQTEISHISSATGQLDSLLADMSAVLFPAGGIKSSPTYAGTVTTSATGWGIRLTTIIEFLKIHPGSAVSQLDLTSDSVQKYQFAIENLKKLTDTHTQFAILKIKDGKEDTIDTATNVGKLLILANTVIARQEAPVNVRLRFNQQRDIFAMAKVLDGNIRAALQPFVSSELALLSGADKIVKGLSKLAKDLGLDRIADFLGKGDLKSIYSSTSETATYAGAAAVALGSVYGILQAKPDVTDQALGQIAKVRDDFSANNAVQKVEAQRGSTDTIDAYVAEQNKILIAQRSDANKAAAVARANDAEEATRGPIEIAESGISKAGVGVDSLGGILDNTPPGSGGVFGGTTNV